MTTFGAPDVDAAEAVAVLMREVTEGRLTAAAMADRAADRCREVFGTCDGPTDPLWPVHVDVCRAVLGHGGLPAAELAQWAAVARSRENPGAVGDNPPAPSSSASEAHGLGSGDADDDADATLKLVAPVADTVDTVDTVDDDLADVPPEVLAEAEAAALAVIAAYRQREGRTR
ncbi:hypothetical protein MDOR_24650 [Mycolicibacterium doricum]|uniref:Flagellar hook-length control protein n=1 Tax=Mycolicibacterium doricum TaxID=126673 RepID=A0A1X1T726_9MYCO|nr:hypothetical protein [Mycolicibacterium doricum]MCV7267177.1 hypothetical protein [Mycolicibacterium doricum]ORV40305.1 hypothetical protein AWC01_12260 [Mycolicibacterium doricum]BBZ08296.1 hypothetical protein MDOR_24650 [Mycolicibacterium doricum]